MALRALRDDDGNVTGYRDDDGNRYAPAQVYRTGEGDYRPVPAGTWGSAGMQGQGPGEVVNIGGKQFVQVGNAQWGLPREGVPENLNQYVVNDPNYGAVVPLEIMQYAAKYNNPSFLDKIAGPGLAGAAVGLGSLLFAPAVAAGTGVGAAGGLSGELAAGGSVPWQSSIPGFGTGASGVVDLGGLMTAAGGGPAELATVGEAGSTMLGEGLPAATLPAGASLATLPADLASTFPGATGATTATPMGTIGQTFANSFLPTITPETVAAANAVPATFGPSSTIADMTASLAGGGSLTAGGIPGVAGISDAAINAILSGQALPAVQGPFGELPGTAPPSSGAPPALPNIPPVPPGGDGTQAPAPVENRTDPGVRPGTTVDARTGLPIDTRTAATSAMTQLLNKAFSTKLTDADTDLIGNLIRGGIGYFGTKAQADSLREIAERTDAMQAPWRQRLSDLYANPAGFLTSAPVQATLDQGTQAAARALSTRYGNPAMAPNAVSEINRYTANNLYNKFGEEANRLAAFGGLNFPATASQGIHVGAANADTGVYDVASSTIANMFAPRRQPQTIGDVMRAIQIANLYGTTTAV